MRRVVITGLGLVSPLGCGYEKTWERLTAGKSATRRIENFDVSDLTCQIACQVPHGDGSDGTFNAHWGYENCDANGDTIWDEEAELARQKARWQRLTAAPPNPT